MQQKTVECNLPLFQLCHHELVSSENTLVLIVQRNLMTLLLCINLIHWSISKVEEILSHRMKGYKDRLHFPLYFQIHDIGKGLTCKWEIRGE